MPSPSANSLRQRKAPGSLQANCTDEMSSSGRGSDSEINVPNDSIRDQRANEDVETREIPIAEAVVACDIANEDRQQQSKCSYSADTAATVCGAFCTSIGVVLTFLAYFEVLKGKISAQSGFTTRVPTMSPSVRTVPSIPRPPSSIRAPTVLPSAVFTGQPTKASRFAEPFESPPTTPPLQFSIMPTSIVSAPRRNDWEFIDSPGVSIPDSLPQIPFTGTTKTSSMGTFVGNFSNIAQGVDKEQKGLRLDCPAFDVQLDELPEMRGIWRKLATTFNGTLTVTNCLDHYPPDVYYRFYFLPFRAVNNSTDTRCLGSDGTRRPTFWSFGSESTCQSVSWTVKDRANYYVFVYGITEGRGDSFHFSVVSFLPY